MAIDKNVRVNLILEDLLSSGAKKVSDLMKGDFKKSFKDAGAQMIIFNQAAELGKKVLAAFDKTIGKTIKAASVQEAAVNRLNSSLFQMGDFTEENSKSLQHFASELQAVTRIGDEVTLGQLALAQSMGANVEQSKALVAAAADMSAALGISFESAVRNLSKTLGGVPGRLAELIPEVKNLNKEQLQSGAIIDIVSKKFQGFAQRDIRTFDGAVAQASNSFGDLLEVLGDLVIKNELVIDTVNGARTLFEDLQSIIKGVSVDTEYWTGVVKDAGLAIGITAGLVGTYIVVANASAIASGIAAAATGAWAAAATLLAGAMAIITSPVTLVVAGVAALAAGIYLAIRNVDLFVGALKVGLGGALNLITLNIRLLLDGLGAAVGFFNKDWGDALKNASAKLKEYGDELVDAGMKQIKNRGATEKATQAKKEQAAAAEEVKKKILAEEQALVKLNIAYSKASSLADSAFKAASAFVPQLKLDEFNKQQDQLEKSLIDLQEKGKALKIKLVDDADATTQVADITKRIADAEAALGALRTQRRVEANNIELAAFTAMLDTQKSLALTVEQQKTSEILNLRAQLLEGTGAGDAAGESAEVIAEKQKMAQLKALRDADLITQKQYESDLTSIKTAARQASLQKEIEDKQMKAQLLGTSPEALAAQLEVQKQQDMIDLENLRTKLQNEQLTEQEFKIAREQLELTSAQKVQQIQEASLKKRLATQQKNGTFEQRMQTRIELAKVQGFKKTAQLRALTQSQEIQGAGQFFSNLSSLTSSKSKSLFNIGKAAAIAGAVINTAQAATAALAPPPLGAGPILGPAVAASAVVAGALNIAQIKAQKFGGGGSASGGGSAAAPPTAPTPQLNVGGQAHGGIDAIPSSLNNKTFLLSGGERVVQPEANRDLTQYLRDAQTQGANAAPSVINITINGNIDSEDTARSMATMVIEEIRERSERGEPIINRQGVV